MPTVVWIKQKPRKKTSLCPLCRKAFSAQGLSGHLRFRHELSTADARIALYRRDPKAAKERMLNMLVEVRAIRKVIDNHPA